MVVVYDGLKKRMLVNMSRSKAQVGPQPVQTQPLAQFLFLKAVRRSDSLSMSSRPAVGHRLLTPRPTRRKLGGMGMAFHWWSDRRGGMRQRSV